MALPLDLQQSSSHVHIYGAIPQSRPEQPIGEERRARGGLNRVDSAPLKQFSPLLTPEIQPTIYQGGCLGVLLTREQTDGQESQEVGGVAHGPTRAF